MTAAILYELAEERRYQKSMHDADERDWWIEDITERLLSGEFVWDGTQNWGLDDVIGDAADADDLRPAAEKIAKRIADRVIEEEL